MSQPEQLERLVVQPGEKIIVPAAALARIAKFVEQGPGLEGIIIIGREGDLSTFNCRPTRGLQDDRIGDMLRAALSSFHHEAEPENPYESLIEIPGMRRWSFRETQQRIQQFISTCLGMTLVLLVCRDNNFDKLRRLRSANITDECARALLRNALVALDKRGLPPPLH